MSDAADDAEIQVLGEVDVPAPASSPIVVGGVIVGIVLVLLGILSAAQWIGRPSGDERTVRAFAAAIDDGDVRQARAFIEEPTILMWPTYWSFLNIEHISPFGDRLEGFIEYQHTLEARTEIGDCTTRATATGEPTEYDAWLRCDYTLRDALSERLAGPLGATFGRLSVGIKEGRIRTVFVIRSDRPPRVSAFRTWITETYPERYAALLTQPPVLQLDVPIIGLVVTDYNGPTASTLVEFADAYVSAGFPAG